jgi:hypothetical protein
MGSVVFTLPAASLIVMVTARVAAPGSDERTGMRFEAIGKSKYTELVDVVALGQRVPVAGA